MGSRSDSVHELEPMIKNSDWAELYGMYVFSLIFNGEF